MIGLKKERVNMGGPPYYFVALGMLVPEPDKSFYPFPLHLIPVFAAFNMLTKIIFNYHIIIPD
jgi:hypothetical protein